MGLTDGIYPLPRNDPTHHNPHLELRNEGIFISISINLVFKNFFFTGFKGSSIISSIILKPEFGQQVHFTFGKESHNFYE